MLKHCESCTCGGAARPLADDPEWQEMLRQSAATDAEILEILAECDRLAQVGREGRHAE